jgi:hypothetical protein
VGAHIDAAPYPQDVIVRSLEDEVDRAERSHLSAEVEADLVDQTYTAAFSLTGKHRGDRLDDEILRLLRRVGQGSIRVALLARLRARQTWDLNPADEEAATAHRMLTDLAASYLS